MSPLPQPTVEELRDAIGRRLHGVNVRHDDTAYVLDSRGGLTLEVVHPSGVVVAQYRVTLEAM